MLKLGRAFKILGFTSLILQTENLRPQIKSHVLSKKRVSGKAFIKSYIFFSQVRMGYLLPLLLPPATSTCMFCSKDQPEIAPA